MGRENFEKVDKIRNSVKSWCRYWHLNVVGLISDNGGHRNYLNMVNTLDDWHDTDAFNDDKVTLNQAWPVVLANINACTDKQILEIKRFCHSRKD